MGTAFVHAVIDDHSRVAYAEIHADEKAATANGVLQRAAAWFADHGVRVERVLSDNGSAYRSHAWREACAELGITPKRTRPYGPQANGKASSDSTAPWPTAGPMRGSTSQPSNATGTARLPPRLQSPPRPLRNRSQATNHPADQRPGHHT
ncbi:hypothetical protein GCM10022237_10920 [Nocardioides ginsengisoli]